MGRTFSGCLALAWGAAVVTSLLAADKPAPKKPAEKEFSLSKNWVVLVNPTAKIRGRRPLPTKGLIENFDDLKFTGPKPGHPFVLGEFADDGEFALVDGALQLVTGNNGAVQFPEADEFELEGYMEHTGFGGWFFAVGFGDGRGYVLSNVTMKESGSPWHLAELRGGTAIPEKTEELEHFEWLREQPFRLTVAKKELTLEVAKRVVADHMPLDNYGKGRVLLGVYDTRYGAKKMRVNSLRMRALVADEGDEKK